MARKFVLLRTRATLRKLAEAPAQVSPAFAGYVLGELQESYANEESPNGEPWDELRPATLEIKNGDARILRRIDQFLPGTEVQPLPGSGVAITMGSNIPYHQTGTRYMVARPTLPTSIPPAWRDELRRLMFEVANA